MQAIVTCGPSYEPLDRVRRLTNFSTGELGVLLAEGLANAGFAVRCFKGEGSVHADPGRGVELVRFATNHDLAQLLQAAANSGVGAVFHAAALCDYRVARVEDPRGRELAGGKFDSRGDGLVLRLEPATKLIPYLRDWFPNAWIVGWKYEVDGTPDQALERGWIQIRECRTDACIVNGPAVGTGFRLCQPPTLVETLGDKHALVASLVNHARSRRFGPGNHIGAG